MKAIAAIVTNDTAAIIQPHGVTVGGCGFVRAMVIVGGAGGSEGSCCGRSGNSVSGDMAFGGAFSWPGMYNGSSAAASSPVTTCRMPQ